MMQVLVTGVAGQIGSYLAELLLARGAAVCGAIRKGEHVPNGVRPLETSLTADTVPALLAEAGPLDAVIHLAADSSVAASWQTPLACFDQNARLTASLAYALAKTPSVRLVHMSSAEIFGSAASPIQNESTPIAPTNPYGVAKASAHLAVRLAREGFHAPASNLIGYLAESERRPPHFVFRKITRGLAEVSLGLRPKLSLGNTSVVRDFCHARDVATATVLLATDAPPGDYVCATGVGHSIDDVVSVACKHLGLDPAVVVETDPALIRPTDIARLVGDSTKLRALGWAPTVDFDGLVKSVIDYDLRALRADR
jgi:GDPmannose 4,6-dehydratase